MTSKRKKLYILLLLIIALIATIIVFSKIKIRNLVLDKATSISEKYNCTIADVNISKSDRALTTDYTIDGYKALSSRDKYNFGNELEDIDISDHSKYYLVFLGIITSGENRYRVIYDTLYENGTKIATYPINDSYDNSNDSKSIDSKPSELTDEEKSYCWYLATNAVKAQLKSPSSAKLPFAYNSDGVSIFQTGSTIFVVGWVEAENSYGAMLRNDFAVTIEKSGSGETATYTVTDCAIG